LRTININLIENENKQVKKTSALIENIDEKTRFISITLVSCACIVFVICVGVWFASFHSIKKLDSELTELKDEHEKLKVELVTTNSIYKNLLEEKEILEIKFLALNQIESSLLPWYSILTDIANTVPKDIQIAKILKATSVVNSETLISLNIQGQLNPRKNPKANPLELISFFALNINENSSLSSYLSNALIRSAEYDEKAESYKFTIETSLKLPEKETKE